MHTETLIKHADIVDVRDIIAKIEELEGLRSDTPDADAVTWEVSEEAKELASLECLMAALKGERGNEQWRGYWYPVPLIHEDYFTAYAKKLVTDCGYLSKDFPGWIAIDWESTAEELRPDYSSISIDGHEYWTR